MQKFFLRRITDMVEKVPRVSIGLPVYDGEAYLEQAINSILSQTYKDFELIIADNASTDRTQEICLNYVKMDKRIKYHRNKTNIGAPRNYNLTFELSSGEYFKWAAHDDIIVPEYLEKCVHVLDSDPSVVLCHSRVGAINQDGVLISNYDDKTLYHIDSWKPHERFADLISSRNQCWSIMGLIRRSCLARTSLQGIYIGSDANLLAELALMGRFHEIPEYLFLRRQHPLAYTSIFGQRSSFKDYRKQLDWWGCKKKGSLTVLPLWKNSFEFFRSINRVPLTFSEKLLSYQELTRWLLNEKGCKTLLGDLLNELNYWRIKLHYR